jgi:hypothetical protein
MFISIFLFVIFGIQNVDQQLPEAQGLQAFLSGGGYFSE